MRIRKRPVQLPPLSPHNTAASPGSELPPEPADHRLSLIGKWVSFGASAAGSLPDKEVNTQINVVELDEKGEDKTRSSNDSRKGNILVAEAAGSEIKLSIPNFFVQGERAFPLKKRRGSFGDEETTMMGRGKIADMKTKMNKKCGGNNNDEVARGGAEDKDAMGNKQKGKLKRARGNLIMEGSRCSRVNGRGWRCCQQTLVGYSLCEHHLGKGRIRNITSVKGRGMAVAPENESSIISLDEEEKEERKEDNAAVGEKEEGEKELKPPLTTTTSKKKGSKMGMVKARSLSSLLAGQAEESGSGGGSVQQYVEAESEKDKEEL